MSYLGDINYYWIASANNNQTVFNQFCDTPFWDSNLTWHTNEPDLTTCFKSTVLIWIPCGFLFIFAPLDLYNSAKSKFANIPWNFLNISRIIISSLIMFVTILDLIFGGLYGYSCIADILGPIMKIIAIAASILLQILHKNKGIMSSGVQFLFWFLLWLMFVPQLLSVAKTMRTHPTELELATKNSVEVLYIHISYVTCFCLISLQLFSHCFADKQPKTVKYENLTNNILTPEIKSSFLKRIFFAWFESTTWKGYRTPLTIDDVHALNPEYRANEVTIPFQQHWLKSVNRNGKTENGKDDNETRINDSIKLQAKKASVVPAMVKTFWGQFWFITILKLITDLMNFTRPFFLGLLITFTKSNDPIWHGFFYMTLLWCTSVFIALMNGQITKETYLLGFKTKTALMGLIYRKVLTISNEAKNLTSVGQIHNLMAVDAQRFMDLAMYIHIIWSGPIVIGLAIYFLWQILGVAVLGGLLVIVILVPLNIFVATQLKKLQSKQMKTKDERIKLMNEILNGIKILKLYAWELSFEQYVLNIRSKEMQIIKKTAYYNTINHISWTLAPYFVTLLSFATFVLISEDNVLDAKTAFVSLTLFGILKQPLIFFPSGISNLIQSRVAVKRINTFLNSDDLERSNEVESIQNDEDFPIKLDNATFSWNGKDISLANINLTISKNELVAVVGVVGSGKSTLISSLLGETQRKSGIVNISGTIAYVPQQAWIRNATIKENILFGKSLDQKFYDRIIEACALEADLKVLPSGDQTEIGERGINLSGGQKQRVSLARAIYRQADIYLLDDPLSAVDAHVGKHIFEQIIGSNGLLADRTRILVTHSINFLPEMSTIYVMKNGVISECGPYNVLVEKNGEFANFIAQYAPMEKKNQTDTNGVLRKSHKEGAQRMRQTKQVNLKNGGKLIKTEDSKFEAVNFRVYLNYIKSVGSVFVTTTIIGSVLYHSLSVYSNIWLSEWTDDPQSSLSQIRDMYLGVYAALGLLQAIAMFVMEISVAVGCLYAAKQIHNNFLRQTLRLPMCFFETNPLGRIINRFSKDIDMVDNIIPLTIRTSIASIFSVLSVIIVITISTPAFTFAIIPLAIAYGLVQKFFVSTSRQLKRIASIARSPVFSHFGETISGNSTIRAYKAETQFIAEAESRIDLNQKCTYAMMIANRWLSLRLELIGSFVILFAVLLAVLKRDDISGATVGLSITYALQVTSVLNFLIRNTSELQNNIVANERLEEYNYEKKEAEWNGKSVDPSWPKDGRIEFKDYSVRYRDNLEIVLKGITFTVESKEKIGVVGRTGAGKSSLMLGLFRILEAAEGTIKIDDVDISEIGLHTLRSRLAVIPQDPVLFYGSVRMNVDPLQQYTDDEIWISLEQSHLKEFLSKTEKGLDYTVTEGGDNLSVGQRQLICLARALLTKAKILIMDEATAAVDLETDDLIQKTIRQQFAHCTILTVAHRLNTVLDYDRVLVLNNGLIVEYDKPRTLLNNEQSMFHKMASDAGIIGQTIS